MAATARESLRPGLVLKADVVASTERLVVRLVVVVNVAILMVHIGRVAAPAKRQSVPENPNLTSDCSRMFRSDLLALSFRHGI